MEKVYLASIGSTLLVSVVSFIGILFLSLNTIRLKKMIFILVSFAIGGLFGDVFFHLLPESMESAGSHLLTGSLVITGILTFFLIEKIISWKQDLQKDPINQPAIKPFGYMNLLADGFHNLIDGFLIGSSFMVDPLLGATTTLAIILHEIPQEIGDFGILVHSGFSVKRALYLNFLSACAAMVGTLAALLFGHRIQGFSEQVMPFAAGGFIYLAGSDLIPELKGKSPLRTTLIQLFFMLLGISLLFGFKLMDH
ncbi:MAG: ZIP family metal transporter [Mangrovibacterium sp.]